MAKVAETFSQFVYKIPANVACEQAPDCFIGEGEKEAGRDSREWSGAVEKNSHPARIASLAL